MKNRIAGWTLYRSPIAVCAQSTTWTRHASTSSAPSAGRKRRLGRLAVVSVAAAGVGAYIRWQQDSGSSSTLNPISFTKYTLVSREPVSSTGSIFTLKPPKPDGNAEVYEEAWRAGVWSVMFKQPQLQIGRDYTPLPSLSGTGDGEEGRAELRFFIRKDALGEVSRYLHGLAMGSVVEMRGPKIERRIPGQTREVLFIAGGTGIAPALQAGYTLLRRSDASHRPRIHILWANRRREDCAGGLDDERMKTQRGGSWFGLGKSSSAPREVQSDATQSRMVRELETLKAQYPGQVTVDYFVDEERTFIQKQDILDFTNSTGGTSSGSLRNKMILVSGPEGFINYMAGPKLWTQGMEVQGPLRGIIGELGLTDWTTWKL